jgi:HEAT repeat protein
MATPSLEDVIARAVNILETATDSDEFDQVWDAVKPVRQMGRPAVDAGIQLLSGTVEQRQAGCAILSTLCDFGNRNTLKQQIGAALAALAEVETDENVCWSIAQALSQVHDPVAAPALVRLAGHPEGDVRALVARALPSSTSPEFQGDPTVVSALIGLMTDDVDEVRDWATFALGTQLGDDSVQIRDALAQRLDDPYEDAQYEALVGLARRRDPRALPATAAALERDRVWQLAIESAEYLADPTLSGRLVELRESWEPNELGIDDAVHACDPVAQHRDLLAMAALSDELQRRIDDIGETRVATLSCPVMDKGTELSLPWVGREAAPGKPMIWDYHALMSRAGTAEPAAAAAAVIDDLTQTGDA